MDQTNFFNNISEEYRSYTIVYHVVELVLKFAQMVTAFLVVAHVTGDPPQAVWITAYAWGCVASLPFLFWRLVFNKDDASTSQILINAVLVFVQMLAELFFMIWTLVFLWFFVGNSSSLDSNTPLYWTSVVFLAFGVIRYVIPLVICGLMSCCACVLLTITASASG